MHYLLLRHTYLTTFSEIIVFIQIMLVFCDHEDDKLLG